MAVASHHLRAHRGLRLGIQHRRLRNRLPLTHLENWAREVAGDQGLPPSGFIDHYITGVIYPESALGLVRLLVAVTVVASWIGYSILRSRPRIATEITSRPAH